MRDMAATCFSSDVACRVADENEAPRQLEAACYALYGLDAEEIAYIEASIGGA